MAAVCVHCGATATLRCSRCHKVWYCSRDCQIADWKSGHGGPGASLGHKASCCCEIPLQASLIPLLDKWTRYYLEVTEEPFRYRGRRDLTMEDGNQRTFWFLDRHSPDQNNRLAWVQLIRPHFTEAEWSAFLSSYATSMHMTLVVACALEKMIERGVKIMYGEQDQVINVQIRSITLKSEFMHRRVKCYIPEDTPLESFYDGKDDPEENEAFVILFNTAQGQQYVYDTIGAHRQPSRLEPFQEYYQRCCCEISGTTTENVDYSDLSCLLSMIETPPRPGHVDPVLASTYIRLKTNGLGKRSTRRQGIDAIADVFGTLKICNRSVKDITDLNAILLQIQGSMSRQDEVMSTEQMIRLNSTYHQHWAIIKEANIDVSPMSGSMSGYFG